MKQRTKAAVVILSWNGRPYLEQFLGGVVQHSSAAGFEVVIADNQSTDGSVEYVRAQFPQVRVIVNPRNGGYAGGYNDALKHIDAEYYILLNQDVEVSPGWIETVLEVMDSNPAIAAAQPKLLDFNREEYFEYAGACGGYVDVLGYAFCRGRMFDTIEKDNGQYDNVAELFWASGACLFVRSSCYWQAGGLDEDFFAHQEEIDLCWRLNSLGYKVMSVPQSVVYHVGGGSLGYGNPRKAYLNFRNNLYLLFKNLPLLALLLRLPLRLLLDDVAALQALLLQRNPEVFAAIYRARFHFIKALPMLIEKRAQVARKSAFKLSPVSVLWQYFVLRRKTYAQLLLNRSVSKPQ